MGETSPASNAAQAERWNGASGQHWIEHRRRHLAEHQNLTPHLFRSAAIMPGERVLDIGCGCGDTTITAARAASVPFQNGIGQASRRDEPGQPGIAVGLDLSAPMLAVAQRLAARAGAVNARFVRGDAQVCPLRRAAFDVMISNFGVMFFDDATTAFARLAAVLRSHGRLAFLSWRDDAENELSAIPLRAFPACALPPRPSADALFTDPRQIITLLSKTGWGDVQITAISELAWLGSDVNDVLRYVRGMPVIRNMTAWPARRPAAERAGNDSRRRAVRRVPAPRWSMGPRRGLAGHRAPPRLIRRPLDPSSAKLARHGDGPRQPKPPRAPLPLRSGAFELALLNIAYEGGPAD